MFLIESMIVGGAERVLINIVNNLDPEQYDITVISVFRYSVYKNYNYTFIEALKPHIHYRHLVDNGVAWKYRLFNVLFNRCNKRLFHRLLIGLQYDVEIAFYEGLPTTFLSHSSNKSSKKIAWLHYGDAFANLTQRQKRSYLQEYSAYNVIVGVSDSVCQNFKERLTDAYPLTTCYNVLESDQIKKDALNFSVERGNLATFVSVGRLTQVKGYYRLLSVCKQLKDDGYQFRLWLVGEGEERGRLEEYIIDNQLSNVVTLWGNQSNPYPYVKAADWFVSSSYAESFSLVAVESMIIGTPVICTQCICTKELLGDEMDELIAENTEDGIYQAMKKVLDLPGLQRVYSEKVQRRSRAFDKKDLIKAVEGIL